MDEVEITHNKIVTFFPHFIFKIIVLQTNNLGFNGFLTVHHSVELKFTTNLMHNFLFIQQ
jgi:hypothetical protein